MVSNVKYSSFKQLDLKGRVPFVMMLVVVLVFSVVSINPPNILLGLFSLYALSGMVMWLLSLRKRNT